MGTIMPRAAHRSRLRLGGPAESEFPGAQVASLADACTLCTCGGQWYFEDGGLACLMCGRRLYVAAELRRAIERYGFGPQPSRCLTSRRGRLD